MNRILLVEDEASLSKVVALNLKLEGFEVEEVSNGREALGKKNEVENFDLVILDVMLPEVSGWDICSAYKSISDTPILFISAKGSSSDKIKGLKLGADDYLAKPFDLEELLLRVQVLILRHAEKKVNTTESLKIGEFSVNTLTFEVFKEEKKITELSKREIELLQLFNEFEGQVVSRDYILDRLWGKDSFPTTRTIDNYILTFRKIFEKDPRNPMHFHSIRGVGYKFLKEK
ncbi:MAG: response regulator transcription factor [Brumimicrobium sp.]|nr:response regulator transcription factor [Brumimicrobium sp.]